MNQTEFGTSTQQVVEEKVAACQEYPIIFNSPLLESFDEESFLEMQVATDEDELAEMLENARIEHDIFSPATITAAKGICAECPIFNECRENAMKVPAKDIYGVVAGMTASERERAQRSAKRSKARELRAKKSVIDENTIMPVSREDHRRVMEELLS